MDHLIDGIARFQSDVFPDQARLFSALADNQSPEVLLLTCSDSRIDPNLITQSKPGDLFIVRNAGNIVPPHIREAGGVTASIEYAVAVLGVQHIVICGHSDCGAMKAAGDVSRLSHLPHVQDWLGHTRAAVEVVKACCGGCGPGQLRELTEQNVLLQLNHLRTHPSVAAGLAAGSLTVHGWYYDIEWGQVLCHDAADNRFKPVAERYARLSRRQARPDVALA